MKKLCFWLSMLATVTGLAAGGDIYEIRPCDAEGTCMTIPATTITAPYGAGHTVYFTVRLKMPRLTPLVDRKFSLDYASTGSKDVAWAVYPLAIGVYASKSSGLPDRAVLHDLRSVTRDIYDCIFKYEVKAGDFALPIRLARKDTSGKPVRADSTDSGRSYYFYNDDKWVVNYTESDETGVTYTQAVDWSIGEELGYSIIEPTDPQCPFLDASLEKSGLYVQTTDFEDREDWTVPEGREVFANLKVGSQSGAEQESIFYVWSENEDAVYLTGANVAETEIIMSYDGGTPTKKKVRMATVTIAKGDVTKEFKIKGVKKDSTANLVLSKYPGYYFNPTTYAKVVDYVTASVKCVEPPPPSVMITCTKDVIIASSDNETEQAQLVVSVTEPLESDLEVTVKTSFEDGLAAEKWGNYLRMSTSGKYPVAAIETKVTIKAGYTKAQSNISLYALLGDGHTATAAKTGHKVIFSPSVSAAVIEKYKIAELVSALINIDPEPPVIRGPEEGETLQNARVGEGYSLPIRIEGGTYGDVTSKDKGYTISVKYNSSFVKLDGEYFTDDSGHLKKDGEDPVLNFPIAGENIKTVIYVDPPLSGKYGRTDERTFFVDVAEARNLTWKFLDGSDGTYGEGDKIKVQFYLSEQYGKNVYVFIKPNEKDNQEAALYRKEADNNSFVTVVENPQGWKIKATSTFTEGNKTFAIYDGYADSREYSFDIILSEEQTSFDKPIAVYELKSGDLGLSITNKVPVIDRIEINSVPVKNGARAATKYPLNYTQKLVAKVSDSQYDLDHNFTAKWIPYLNGEPQDYLIQELEGDPNKNTLEFKFDQAGIWTMQLQVKDKDMDDWAEADYRIELEVIDAAPVEIVTPEVVVENETRAKIQYGLGGYFRASEALDFELQVIDTSAVGTGTDKIGSLKLDLPNPVTDTVEIEGVTYARTTYKTKLRDGGLHDAVISEMDGTILSAAKGFRIIGKVTSTLINPQTGLEWREAYTETETRLYVENATPIHVITPEENTNAWNVAGGAATSYPIRWTVKNDVPADLAGKIKVRFVGCANADEGSTDVTEAGASGVFVPNFAGAQNEQVVTLTIEDKDGGLITKSWKYNVRASKMLATGAVGPSGGTSTSALSQHYAQASGLGQGHVYVDGATFSEARNFILNWNCGREKAASLLAYGYASQAVDDGSLDNGKDIAIEQNGSATAGQEVANPYTYTDAKDSFFYKWIVIKFAAEDDSKEQVDNAFSPTYFGKVPAVGTISLPTEEDEEGGYQNTIVEAIFSKEYREKDNCGDLNNDGIPDLAIYEYGFGIYDKTAITFNTGKDLTNLANYNDDGDYLPYPQGGKPNGAGTTNLWAKGANAFTAKLELRGHHDGLNKYRNKAGVIERDYSDEEMTAWEQAGFDPNWTPENPSNPTVADTDSDGLPDGYEYYWWYEAHVRHHNGRKFNVNDPVNGDVLPWTEIEASFNPTERNTIDINKRDTDADGLPDILEFSLGTSPVDFDTDGDGIPDYYEVTYCPALDPCLAMTDGQHMDGTLNPDNDYMAKMSTSMYYLEAVNPTTGKSEYYVSQAYLDYYNSPIDTKEEKGLKFNVGSTTYYYITDSKPEDICKVVPLEDGGTAYYLSVNLPIDKTFALSADEVRGASASFVKGTKLAGMPEEAEGYNYRSYRNDEDAGFTVVNMDGDFGNRTYSAWRYGKGGPIQLGREKTVPTNYPIIGWGNSAVQLLHWQVYQWRGFELDDYLDIGTGFNPLTAWAMNPHGKVHSRWIGTEKGAPVDTAGYTTLDEYLVMNFVAHAKDEQIPTPSHDDTNRSFNKIIGGRTTLAYNLNEIPGADSDKDGVPDGWELYVQCGPGTDYGTRRLNTTYAGFDAPFSPKNGVANHSANPDTRAFGHDPITGSPVVGDKGGMTELMEFVSSDSVAFYTSVDTIPNGPVVSGWVNKLWPTDPWSDDTDCDGISDIAESGAFIYKVKSGDDYSLPTSVGAFCAEGGGLNPCSWDTDNDGLPDPWELQFTGTWYEPSLEPVSKTVAMVNALEELNKQGVTSGFIGGMDGTVADAYSPTKDQTYEWYKANNVVYRNRDYDFDGLQNWQEYLTMVVRSFRYDDNLSPWTTDKRADFEALDAVGQYNAIREWRYGSVTNYIPLNPIFYKDFGGEWIDQDVYLTGPNPITVVDQFDYTTAYGSVNRRGWEQADSRVYFFPDGPNHILRRNTGLGAISPYQARLNDYLPAHTGENEGEDVIQQEVGPTTYFSCSPINYDSDSDGMDDYYEMFHGLNPLLGGVDLIHLACGSIDATHNFWTYYYLENPEEKTAEEGWTEVKGNDESAKLYDFTKFPWMAGLPEADPDGDDIRNVNEAIQANAQANKTYLHTDPTPLWMTDSSDLNSLVSKYYGYLSIFNEVGPSEYRSDNSFMLMTPYFWAFETNEGFDSDHDGVGDYRETQRGTDPRDTDSPVRRQAIYFTGTNSAAQVEIDAHISWLNNEQFFTEFTVECWAKPDPEGETIATGKKQIILERMINNNSMNPGDVQYLKRNFQLGITEGGLWYAVYDPDNTGLMEKNQVIAYSAQVATTNWTHLAAKFDGEKLTLFINGQPCAPVRSSAKPVTFVQTVSTDPTLWYNKSTYLPTDEGKTLDTYINGLARGKSIILGAGAKTTTAMALDEESAWETIDEEGNATKNYDDFYRGWVDEVRIWDGARTDSEITANYNKRFTLQDVSNNRDEVYGAWLRGCRRDIAQTKIEGSLPAELVYHFSFDGMLSAHAPEFVATSPYGFDSTTTDSKSTKSRPDGYVAKWWNDLAVKSIPYNNYAYIPWIPNTVTHLPLLDETTYDSVYWSKNTAGRTSANEAGFKSYAFPNDTELYNQQELLSGAGMPTRLLKHRILDELYGSTYEEAYDFDCRVRSLMKADLLPLGNTYARYCPEMWDDQGPTTTSEVTGKDDNFNYLADWWETLATNKYTLADGSAINPSNFLWETELLYNGVVMNAGLVYKLDLSKGAHATKEGGVLSDDTFRQNNDLDGDNIPDWWEELFGIDATTGDYDSDGLSDYYEYLVGFGPAPFGLANGWPFLSPAARMSAFADQRVDDYFLKLTNDAWSVTAKGKTYTGKGWYLGEILTDHDMIEDWWENQYDNGYSNSGKWDALTDYDEDGWSNWAECRASLWRGLVNSDTIEYYLDGEQHVNAYPEPAIGIRVGYHGDQNISGKQLVVRTTTGYTDRTDATFIIPSPTVGTKEGTLYLGGYVNRITMHGFMNPGSLVPGAESYQYAQLSSDQQLVWNYNWYKNKGYGHLRYNTDVYWYGLGTYDEYLSQLRKYPHIEIEDSSLTWNHLARSFSDAMGRYGDIRYSAEEAADSTGGSFGSINYRTGEFTLNMDRFRTAIGENLEKCIFRVVYAYRIGNEWPQEFWLSQATTGHVKEGSNTIEAFIDLDENGVYTAGEPYGVVKNVDIGWHKSPMSLIELTDDAVAIPRVNLGGAQNATGAKTIRIIRKSINGDDEINPRTVFMRTYTMDDRAYINEGDVYTSNKFDLDWRYLTIDAKANNVEDLSAAGYVVEEVMLNGDGSTSNRTITAFTKNFRSVRAKPLLAEPVDSAVLLNASPTFKWMSSDPTMTAFKLQVLNSDKQVIYDSGINLLPGKVGTTVGENAYTWTAPLYVNEFIVTNGVTTATKFEDGKDYFWRVALLNAKYNTADSDEDFSEPMPFKVDLVRNGIATGYGKCAATVRYFGPGDITNYNGSAVIVEAFENADFSGQPMARTRVNVLDKAVSNTLSDVTANIDRSVSTNAFLQGLEPGTVYLRAFIDRNGNGERDNCESWGYANMIDSGRTDIYTPKGLTITDDVAACPYAVIYIEDTDLNQNDVPDCCEDMVDVIHSSAAEVIEGNLDYDNDGLTNAEELDNFTDPYSADTDGDGMDDGWEIRNGFDPLNNDSAVFAPNDVMAYKVALLDIVERNGVKYVVCPNVKDDESEQLYKAIKLADGRIVVGAPTVLKVENGDVRTKASVVLIHSGVYDFYGYSTTTARMVQNSNGEYIMGDNTAQFTALWKYITDTIYLPQFDIESEPAVPGWIDGSNNLIDDGWELYVSVSRLAPSPSMPTTYHERVKHAYDNNYDPWDEYSYFKVMLNDGERAQLVKFTNEDAFSKRYVDVDNWSYAAAGDVMAYVSTDLYVAYIGETKYVVRPEAAELNVTNKLYTCFELGNGQIVVGAPTALEYGEADYAAKTNVVVIHSGVYDFFGYDKNTARANTTNVVNTVSFTKAWKLVTNEAYLPLFGIKSDSTVLDAIDGTANAILDGWELYVALADKAEIKSFPVSNIAEMKLAFDYNYDPWTSIDGIPNLWKILYGLNPADENLAKTNIVEGEVMAYATKAYQIVWLSDGSIALAAIDDKIAVGDDATKLQLTATYPYGNASTFGTDEYDGEYGVGVKFTATPGSKVIKVVTGEAVLVHKQVLDEFGFNANTACPSISSNSWVNTKTFTVLDKYMVVRYLDAINGTNKEKEVVAAEDWIGITLDPNYTDNDFDGIPDGWELYVGTNPWNYNDRNSDTDNDGLKLIEEYDNGHISTNPWNADTDGDGIIDRYVYEYLLKDGGDTDGDGLSNHAEYLISEVFKFAKLDPKNPKTDGMCIDYYRKIGDLYLGEVFSDHDRVNDQWEGKYAVSADNGKLFASQYLYDPEADYDLDGWSNYAEAKAGTDPTHEQTLGIKEYVKAEYPIPTIEANIVYNGTDVITDPIVFKAWSCKTDRDMLGAPDAIWTVSGGQVEANAEGTLQAHEKYIGKKPTGIQQYYLGPGSVGEGTVKILFLDTAYTVVQLDVTGQSIVSAELGTPEEAKWYFNVVDKAGKLYAHTDIFLSDEHEVGTIDYNTGRITINFDSEHLGGYMVGSNSNAEGEDTTQVNAYHLLDLDNSYIKLSWQSKKIGTSGTGTFYLSDSDTVSSTAKSHGHVREGLNHFVVFVDSDKNGDYTPGELFAFVKNVDVGWQGAKFTAELTATHPVFARIDLKTLANDRQTIYGTASGNGVGSVVTTYSGGKMERVRVYRTAINGIGINYDDGLRIRNRCLFDEWMNFDVRSYLHEGDFLKGDEPDIDWANFQEEIMQNNNVAGRIDPTNVTYRIVLGNGTSDVDKTNNILRITVNRSFSFDKRAIDASKDQYLYGREMPIAEPLKIVNAARPSFKWTMNGFNSYTAFRLQLAQVNGLTTNIVYDSGVNGVPVARKLTDDERVWYIWEGDCYFGDQVGATESSSRAQILPAAGDYIWRVTMLNAKYQSPKWSDWSAFSSAVNNLAEMNDNGYSTIKVAVKYAGPNSVLKWAGNVGTTNGSVRVQAFTTADFSGKPISQAVATNVAAIADLSDNTSNVSLIGLPAKGSYYIRAYIDSNGNYQKDDWESWGGSGEAIALDGCVIAPTVGVWIDDSDVNGNLLPDAWEYENVGSELFLQDSPTVKDGAINLNTKIYEAIISTNANFSVGLQNGLLDGLCNPKFASLVLGMTPNNSSMVEIIRAAVAKNIKPNTVMISSMTLSPDGRSLKLTIGADFTETVAGEIVNKLYNYDAQLDKVAIDVVVLRKNTLIDANWEEVTTISTEIGVKDAVIDLVEGGKHVINPSNGFYKIKIIQK